MPWLGPVILAKDFRGGPSHVFGGDRHGLVGGGSDNGASCQVVRLSEKTARSLMEGGDCRIVEQFV